MKHDLIGIIEILLLGIVLGLVAGFFLAEHSGFVDRRVEVCEAVADLERAACEFEIGRLNDDLWETHMDLRECIQEYAPDEEQTISEVNYGEES